MKPQTVKPGAVLNTRCGEPVTIGTLIAAGGQGEVYRAQFRGERAAAKIWFQRGTTAAQRVQVEKNIHKGPPSSAFVWPRASIVGLSGNSIGYVMDLATGRYVTLEDRLNGKCDFTFYPLVTACIELAHAMKALHQSHGMSLVDLNSNNLLVNGQRGGGGNRIIDVDNCAPQNVSVGVLFSFGLAAPEVIRREANPSLTTDLYSLAATIYALLVGGLPLEGKRLFRAKCLNMEALTDLHGTNPRFVFHPQDRSNAPDPRQQAAMIANWTALPGWIKNVFTRVFTTGLADTSARPREAQWIDDLVRLRDSICVCRKCGTHVFLDESMKAPCWHCKAQVEPQRLLKTDRSTVVLNVGSHVFPHHALRSRRGDLKKPLGRVVRSERDNRVIGLKNVGELPWRIITPRGHEKSVTASSVAALARGNKIVFGQPSAVAQVV